MNIVIFEDDRNFAENLENVVTGYGYHVVLNTDNLEYLEKHLILTDRAELYLLDIIICDNPEGLDAFRLIQEDSIQNLCVFITNYLDYILFNPALKINVFSFIKKHNLRELSQTLKMAEQRLKNENLLIIHSKFNQISVSMAGIYYMESISGSVYIYHEDGKFQTRMNLYALMDKLDDDFIQCHRSYVVNKRKVIKYDKSNQMIILRNGYRCPYVKERIDRWLL